MLLRIWRVEISHEECEDKVAGDGYCGYSAMSQIINGHNRKYNLRNRGDRIEVGMAIRNILSKAAGVTRSGYEKLRATELNAKERAEIAYKQLMAEETHFLSHRGLQSEYWMRGMLVDGRCDDLKFSSWVKSVWDGRVYMLQECQYSKMGEKLTIGEWRRVLTERMLMFRDNHYYSREGGLIESFELTLETHMRRMSERLKLGGKDMTVESEEIILIDKTPVGSIDSLLTAEAIMAGRFPPSILDIGKAGTTSKLRSVRKEIKGFDDGEEDHNEAEEGIGYEEMRGLCKKHNNGMVVIRNGIMERMCGKSDKPDVILDEDMDHFYLNGAGPIDKGDGTRMNKIAFWNCNGWRGELHVSKERTLGEMAANEDVEMICVTDTRLDNFSGLHVVENTCEELKRHTGKTWAGRDISRKEDIRAGGAMVFHTANWTGVKISDKISYGTCVEVIGKWAGVRHTVLSVYRPCNNEKEGSLRATLDYELRGKLEELLWGIVAGKGDEEIKVVGGDFSMSGDQMDKKIVEMGGGIERIKVPADQFTFRRMDSVNGKIHATGSIF